MPPLDDARARLRRALDAESSTARSDHLWYAAADLYDSGCRRWAARAAAAARRIGPGDGDMRDLLLEVERAVSRGEHAEP